MRLLLLLIVSLLPGMALAQPGALSGNLSSVGSDTLGYLMTLWGEDFSRQAPGVNVQVQASGSSTAPTALAAGAAQLGPMSRPMQADERQAFEARYGYPPLAVPVAMDALVVVVNQRNPLQQIEPRQLDAIHPHHPVLKRPRCNINRPTRSPRRGAGLPVKPVVRWSTSCDAIPAGPRAAAEPRADRAAATIFCVPHYYL